jgi:hypothetical protein
MSYSLIITDVVTRDGNKTFTLRWSTKDIIKWEDIFQFISNKSGFNKKFHTVKVGKYFIKYDNIDSIREFKLEDYAYYDSSGKITKSGLLKTDIDNKINKCSF